MKRALIVDEDAFLAEMDEMLAKQVKKHERLLFQKDGWTMDAESKVEILHAMDNLARRLMHRASLFAMHRSAASNAEQMKKKKVKVQLDDLEFAWKSLE